MRHERRPPFARGDVAQREPEPPLSLDAADDQAEPLTTCRVSGWSNCRSGA